MILKQKQLFFAKAFFGSMIRNWNPQNQPFIAGVRFRVHIIDLAYSNFHLRKFLFLVYYASQRRLKTCFVLRPHYSPIYPTFVPFALYAPYFVGGVISNFTSVRQHFKANGVSSYLPRFPDLAVFLNDLSRMDYLINEGFITRTPFVSFGDTSTNLQQSVYGVGGKISDLATASFIVNTLLAIIKRGQLRIKIHFKLLLHKAVKVIFKRRFFPSLYYTHYAHFRKQLLSADITKQTSLFDFNLSKPYFLTIRRSTINYLFLVNFVNDLLLSFLGLVSTVVRRTHLLERNELKEQRIFLNWANLLLGKIHRRSTRLKNRKSLRY